MARTAARTSPPSNDVALWDALIERLRTQHASVCRHWFTELEPLGVSGGSLLVRTRTVLQRDYLQTRCADAFNDAARDVTGHLVTVVFLGPEDSPPESTRNESPTRSQVPESLVINPDCSFSNYVVGPSNRLAQAAALAVSRNPGRTYNPLFIHGGVGLGKTHLLQAICVHLHDADHRVDIRYLSCEAFVTQYLEAVQDGTLTTFRDRFRAADVLVIDDIHYVTGRGRSQEEFFHTFNALHHAGKQIVLSSDAQPCDIPDLEERLVSRFNSGLVAEIEPPCLETRVAILQSKARLRNTELPDDAAMFLAKRIDSNVRDLEGSINRLIALSGLDGEPISLELAQQALGDDPQSPRAEPQVEVITRVVTDFFGVRLTDLQSRRRQRSIALPRQVCMYLTRQHTSKSLEEIGGHFGGRDHTTVMHAVKTIGARRDADNEFDVVIRSLEDRIRTP